MKIFRITVLALASILSISILISDDVIGAIVPLFFVILSITQIFVTKNYKRVSLIIKIIILIMTASMFLLNLHYVSLQSSATTDVIFWVISFIAFAIEPQAKGDLGNMKKKITQTKKWLVVWLISLLVFVTTFTLSLFNADFVNGATSVWANWIFSVSSIVFLITFSVWLVLKLKKWAMLPIFGLILMIIGLYFFVEKYKTNPETNIVNSSSSTPSSDSLSDISTNWKEFVSPSGTFKFEYPDNFIFNKSVSTTGNPSILYRASSLQQSAAGMPNVEYSVTEGVYGDDTDPSLMISMPNFVDLISPLDSSTSGEIISHKLTYFGKYKAFDYVAKVDGQYWIVKYVVVKQTMYNVYAFYSSEANYNESDYNRFINSFTVLGE